MQSNVIKELQLNTIGTDYIISDIHGHYKTLLSLLDYIKFNRDTDRLISVGDIIDRAPTDDQNVKMLELLNESWFYSVIGNHEEFIIKRIIPKDSVRNGQSWWVDKLDDIHFMSYIDSLIGTTDCRLLPSIIITQSPVGLVGVVHASIPTNWFDDGWGSPFEIQHERVHDVYRDRINIEHDKIVSGVDYVVHGHKIVDKVLRKGNRLYIDTGLYETGLVSLLNLTDGIVTTYKCGESISVHDVVFLEHKGIDSLG